MVVRCWSLGSHHVLKQKATLQLESCFNERLRLHVMGIFGNVGKALPRQKLIGFYLIKYLQLVTNVIFRG